MIHLITKGGLGNQMFQYAFATQLQKKHRKESIYINNFWQPLNGDNRKLGLHHFKLSDSIHICSKAESYLLFSAFFLRILKLVGATALFKAIKGNKKANIKKLLNDKKELFYDAGAYFSLGFFENTRQRVTKGLKHIFGYHLSSTIVEGIENDLREAFTITAPVSEKNRKLRQEIEQCNAVCLHIRLGDYKFYKQLQVCTEHYFYEAVRQALAELKNPVFYIFSTGSDDIQWIKENYHFDADIRYVDMNNPDYEELYLMTACKHFIISNSTFSWWAAFLGGNHEEGAAGKRVWAPRPWFAGTEVEMYLPTWTIVDTRP